MGQKLGRHSLFRSNPPGWPKHLRLVCEGGCLSATNEGEPLWDAELSPDGINHARKFSSTFEANAPELCVCSPLSRAVQTCLLAAPPNKVGSATHYEVWPELTAQLEEARDVGREPKDLCDSFPQLDFSGLSNVWWYAPGCDDPAACRSAFLEGKLVEPRANLRCRVDAAVARIRERSENSIVVFAHASFLMCLLARYFGGNRDLERDRITHLDVQGPWELAPCGSEENSESERQTANCLKQRLDPATRRRCSESKAGDAANCAQQALAALKSELRSEKDSWAPGELNKLAGIRWRELDGFERERRMRVHGGLDDGLTEEQRVVEVMLTCNAGTAAPQRIPLRNLVKHRSVAWQWREGGTVQYATPIGEKKPLSPFGTDGD